MRFAVIAVNGVFALVRIDLHNVATVEAEYPIEAEFVARQECALMNANLEAKAKEMGANAQAWPGQSTRRSVRYFEPDAFA